MSFDQSMQEFYERLDNCNDSSSEQREVLEAELWSRFGADKTVLILDMAGFTTKVQKYGLLFFFAQNPLHAQNCRTLAGAAQWTIGKIRG